MKALTFSSFGDPKAVVAARDVPLPEPGPGEARVRVRRAPIHNHDLATVRGVYGIKPSLPAIGGSELCGTIDALGTGVALETGARIAAMARGTWAEYALVAADALVPLPPSIDDDAGAQLLAMPLSALVLFDSLGLKAGDWMVQNAAGGAVGKLLDRIARRAGVNVINLVRRPEAVAELQSLGALHAIATDDDGWPARVRALAGDVRAVVDSVCDARSTALHALLGEGGEHVVFGALGASLLRIDPGALIFKQSRVRGFWMTTWFARASAAEKGAAVQRLFELARAGELPLAVEGVFALDASGEAFAVAETPGRRGKVLFAP